jgi:hypothetical protein
MAIGDAVHQVVAAILASDDKHTGILAIEAGSPSYDTFPHRIKMKVLGLLSGGKDSCYNLMHCIANGHEVSF